jgi:hypothetical protein
MIVIPNSRLICIEKGTAELVLLKKRMMFYIKQTVV